MKSSLATFLSIPTPEVITWDFLMAAVEKIESLGHPVYINCNHCVIYEKVGKNHGWFIDRYGKTKMEAVQEAVEVFVDWLEGEE